jgi:hypothetical protein
MPFEAPVTMAGLRIGPFGNALRSQQAVKDSEAAIALLDQLEADPARPPAASTAVAAAIPR